MPLDLSAPVLQEEFAAMVGISQPKVSQLISEGVIPRDGTAAEWLLAYCERLREQAAGRGQELTSERAALARSQRIGQDLKNAVAQKQYAPIGLLTDVLAAASAALVDRFDAFPADLRKRCPDLSEEVRLQLENLVGDARNEWARATTAAAMRAIEDIAGGDEDEGDDLNDDDVEEDLDA